MIKNVVNKIFIGKKDSRSQKFHFHKYLYINV